MENKILQPLAWLGNLFIFVLLLYMAKSAVGIDLNPSCHAEEVLFGNCKFVQDENLINGMGLINQF